MPDGRSIDDLDKDDDNDLTPAGIVRRLAKVGRILERANSRLDAITAGWAQPPEPDRPTVGAAIGNVQTKASATIAKVGVLQALLDRSVTGGS